MNYYCRGVEAEALPNFESLWSLLRPIRSDMFLTSLEFLKLRISATINCASHEHSPSANNFKMSGRQAR